MTNRIAATYDGSGAGGPHTITFTAPTPGARLILVISCWSSISSDIPEGWTEDYHANGYNHVHILSKIATGSETSVVLNHTDYRLHAVLYERDDCPNRLFSVAGTSSSASVSTLAATVPANATGRAFGVVNAPNGTASATAWNQGLSRHFAPDDSASNSAFVTGPLPAAGSRTFTVSNLAMTSTTINLAVMAVVGYGSTDAAAPSAPSSLRATSITGTSISVEWDAATDDVGVTGYGVYLNGSKQGSDQAGLSYTFTGLTAGQTYLSEVDARDAAGNRSPRAQISVVAEVDVTPPAVPPNLRVVETTHTSITVAWDASTDSVGVAGYGVFVGGVRQGPDQAEWIYTITRLARGTTYTIGVDAADAVNNRSAMAGITAATLAGGDPSAPPNLTATAGREQITLAWGAAAAGALPIARYEVLLDGVLAASTAQLGYVLEDLEAGSVHEVAVRAVDAGLARGPAVLVTVTVPVGDWVPVASPVYRLGDWVGNARDAHGVTWTVEEEEGWSSSAAPITLGADSDNADGGFDGPGRYGSRIVTLSGTAVADSRVGMLAAQERLTGVLSASGIGVLRVAEAHLTRQAKVRLEDTVEITDRDSLAFEWSLVVKASNPRRFARRSVYAEVTFEPAQTTGATTITMAGDYPTIPARFLLYGPVTEPVIRVEELGLEIRTKAGTVLPDARYALDIDLATREVWALVPPDVWPEPRPGRTMLARFPARFALAPGPNTVRLSGGLVVGQEATSPRLVIEATDAWI
ncbi:fibronectin type III domain-containing protein [Nonomuraea basaltis]|uniref:fibronectin type III domain-containing protein n=1 Tax=Nonomuraea basaltis TaxID=2495887 RepID=UPI00110C4914|nr:fibronectin type III domain-containing protein [Nonomuraea basaltis]TMR93289.1 fibronectin type III domain-containing protein [Nonomuraea basaltis]